MISHPSRPEAERATSTLARDGDARRVFQLGRSRRASFIRLHSHRSQTRHRLAVVNSSAGVSRNAGKIVHEYPFR